MTSQNKNTVRSPVSIIYDVADTSSVGAMKQVAAKLAPSYVLRYCRSPLGELLRAAP